MSITRINSTKNPKRNNHFEKAFTPALNRLTQIVTRQYGCDLEYSPLMKLSKENLQILRKELHKEQPLYVDNIIFFPVIVRGELMGAAQLKDVRGLSTAEVRQLHEVIALVLESSLLNVCRLDVLQQLEEQLQVIESSPNVVRINRPPKNEHPITPRHYKKSFNLPCLIESKNKSNLHRTAFEIYTRTDRHAFVSYKDLDADTLIDVESLVGLGPITIFIPEITELSIPQQETLTQYLLHFCTPGGPQIIAGTEFDQISLLSQKNLSKKLFSRISVAFLNLTKHNDRRVQDQMIEHFIEGLAHSPPSPTPLL